MQSWWVYQFHQGVSCCCRMASCWCRPCQHCLRCLPNSRASPFPCAAGWADPGSPAAAACCALRRTAPLAGPPSLPTPQTQQSWPAGWAVPAGELGQWKEALAHVLLCTLQRINHHLLSSSRLLYGIPACQHTCVHQSALDSPERRPAPAAPHATAATRPAFLFPPQQQWPY